MRIINDDYMKNLTNISITPQIVENINGLEVLIGKDNITQRNIKIALTNLGDNYSNRMSINEALIKSPEHLIFMNCRRNRNGTYMAFMVHPGTDNINDNIYARITAPFKKNNGSYGQNINCIHTDKSIFIRNYKDLIDNISDFFDHNNLNGRISCLVRGWHPDKVGCLGFEIRSLYNKESGEFYSPEESLSSFINVKNYIYGLNEYYSGEQCLDMVNSLMFHHHDEIIWEIIPKETFSMNYNVLKSFSEKKYIKDYSKPYLVSEPQTLGETEKKKWTGCLKSIVGFNDNNGLWGKFIFPHNYVDEPIPEFCIPTKRVFPILTREVECRNIIELPELPEPPDKSDLNLLETNIFNIFEQVEKTPRYFYGKEHEVFKDLIPSLQTKIR